MLIIAELLGQISKIFFQAKIHALTYYNCYYFMRTEAEILGSEKEKLLKKLIDVEFEGRAAIHEVSKLREACRRMKEVSLIWELNFTQILAN